MQKVDFSDYKMPRYNEIPNVGLYLKQVVTFVNEALAPVHTQVTATMLSNYVKLHILPNPEKKMYSRDHIAYFLFIVLTKNVISLENIKKLLKLQQDSADISEAYNYFCDKFEGMLKKVSGADIEVFAEKKESYEKFLLKQTIITLAQKIYMDECFLD